MTTVIFICPKCGVLYRTEQESFTQESAGRFDCIDCNAEVFAWRGLYDFVPFAISSSFRTAVSYITFTQAGAVQEIIAIVRQVASGLPPETTNPLDDDMPGGQPPGGRTATRARSR